MSYQDKYKKLRKSRGSTVQESRINDSKRQILNSFKDSPLYEEVFLYHANSPTPVETTPAQFAYNGKIPSVKTLLVYPDFECFAGDFAYRPNKEYWLCQYMDENAIYRSAVVERCNQFLKWINHSGEIKSYPAVMQGSTSLGVDENNVLSVPDGERKVSVQANSDTVLIRRDERFILGNEAFKVIDYDFITQEGIVKLSLKSDGINTADDNMELGIANYYSKQNFLAIILAEPDSLNLGVGQTEKIDLRVVDKNGEVDMPVQFYSDDPQIISVDQQGNLLGVSVGATTIRMKIENRASNSIIVNCTETYNNNYRSSITGADFIVYGKTATFTVNYFNNDINENQETVFMLTDQDGKTTSMAFIVDQNKIDNSCTVKAIPYNRTKGIVLLHASNLEGTIKSVKRIEIIPYTVKNQPNQKVTE